MKHFKQFFVFALLALFSVGAWGATATFTFNTSEGLEALGITEPAANKTTALSSVSISPVTITAVKNDASTIASVFKNSAGTSIDLRIYKKASGGSKGSGITISVSDGYKLTGITGLWTSNVTAVNGTLSSGSWSPANNSTTTSVEIYNSGSSTASGCTVITVSYESTGSGGSDPVAVTGVALDEDEITLAVGEKQTLTATVSPAGATNKSVTWESDDTEVATVVDGLVTALATGNATITVKTNDGDFTATCDVTVTAAETPTLTFDFSAQGYENGVQYTSIDGDANITISFGDGANDGKYYNTGTAIRIYGGGHMTIAGGEGVTISKIVLEFGAGDGSNAISTDVGTYDNGQWIGSAQTVTFTAGGTSGHRRIMKVKVFYEVAAITVAKPTISGETPFLSSTTVTLSHADADHIYYTTNGDAPTTSSTEYSDPFELTNTSTVKAIAVKGSDVSAVAEKTFTKATIMTVAEARTAIDNGGDLSNKYVAGIISQIDSYDGTHHSITYWISDDGTTTDQLEVYSGKGLNGADFAGLSDLSLGDAVIVKGTLKNYKGTDEFDMNSQIIQLNRTIAAPTFTPDGAGFLTTLSVALASATDGAEVRYTVDGSDPVSTSTLYENPIELSATTTIKAAAFKGSDVSAIITRTFTKGTKITVAEALAALDLNSPIENQFVYGKVSTASTGIYSGKLTYYISDDGSTNDQLEVYNGLGLNGVAFAEKTDLQVGDEVTVYGTLKIYNEVKEFEGGNYLLEFNRPVIPTYSITYVENGANEDIDNVAEATNLPDPLPTVTKDSKAFGGWFTDSEFNTPAVAGAALTDDVILYAKWNDISPWASVYTSNVAIASDVVSHVTIAETTYDAVKANKASTATITLPQGVTTIHLHLVAWNGEAQTVSVTGDCFNDAKELTIEANAAVSGSSTTYNLGASGVNYYFSLTPDKAVNADDVITITAASGKRFVLFGVNQEGGVLPVLESIEIGGDLTTKTGYKVGDDLDLDGLTVSATYSLGGVAQTPVDITDKLGDGLTLTYDPLVEGQTEVTITATYEGETDDINITLDEAVASADPKIYVDKLNVNFGTVAKDAVVADQTITVTLTNVAAATAVLGGTNPEAFNIDKTALVDGDVITISVASTATYGSYSAKITISDNAAEAEAKIVNLSLAVEDVETPVSTISKWVAATDADLVDGAEVLITGVKEAVTYAMGVQNNNNRAAVAASVDGKGVLTPGEGTMAFTLVAQVDGTFALRTSNGKYLYAAASGSNHLKTQAEVDVNAKWTLTIASAVAEGSSNRNVMQFNSGSSLFSCYGSASQTDIALYTRAKEKREGFTVGKLATVCVPYAVAQEDIIGADVYEIAGKNEAGKIVFDQVTTGGMKAGVAYLVQAKAETATFYYSGNAVAEPQNEGKALKGTFAEIDIAAADAANVYFFKDNALWSAKETGVKILAYRAWLDMSAVGNAGPSPAPGRRRITMDVHGENAATGMDELNASEAPRKMIIDGKMYILRGEKMYNANGILVK